MSEHFISLYECEKNTNNLYLHTYFIFCYVFEFVKCHLLFIFICMYDVISSVFPFDRYIAVTQPIKYAKHRNSRRVCLTIVVVWAISAAIGAPIVLGLNNTPDRDPSLCMFYNTDFIVYSSLISFYIPCIIMVFLYYNIFKVSFFPFFLFW